MVPKGWKEVKLGEVIKHQKGYAFKSDSYINGGVRIIRISDTTRDSIHDKSPVYIDEDETASLSQYKLNTEDIILSTVGSRPHLLDSMVGKAVKVPAKDEGALLNQNLVKIVPKDNLITNNYLFSMITKSKFNYFISTLVRGNANQVSITLKELFAYTFPLPSLPEQQKIAKILSTWDKAISTTERLIGNSTQQKKALMQQLLTGKQRLAGFDKEWISEPLENVVGKIYGGGTPSKNVPEYWDGDIPWVTVKDLIATKIDGAQQYINKFGLENSSANMVPAGTVIIATRMALGKAVIASCDVAINQDLKAITGSPKIDSVFLHYWLLLQAKAIEKLGTGSTVKGVQLETIKSLRMQIPSSIQEQQKIATVLTNADKEIELLEQQLADLQQEKKALMQVLLTGKRRVMIDGEVA